jgi:hypothetical protein
MWSYILAPMIDPKNPKILLEEAAKIPHLERGKISILREGPTGPFYNHQCRQDGKNVSRYVPRDQVQAVQEAIDGYAQFQSLIEQYVDQTVEKTREEIARDSKKSSRSRQPNSSSRKSTKSSNSSGV